MANEMQPKGKTSPEEQEQNKAVVRRVLDAFNSGDTSIIDEVTDPNLVSHTPPPGVKPDKGGLKHQVDLLRGGFPDAKFEEESLVADGDMVILRWRMTGTHTGEYFFGSKPTGKKVTHVGHEFVRVKNGKIVEHRDSADPLVFMDKLGLLDENMLGLMKKVGVRGYA